MFLDVRGVFPICHSTVRSIAILSRWLLDQNATMFVKESFYLHIDNNHTQLHPGTNVMH